MSPPLVIENPAVRREPDLLPRAAAWLAKLNDMLLDRLAARTLNDPAFRRTESPYPLDEITAVAQVLRVLAKPVWNSADLDVFDAHYRLATCSDAFPDEFEEARHRIQRYVQQAREQLNGHS